MTEERTPAETAAIAEFNAAGKGLGSKGPGAEKRYGVAYARLVTLGLAPKLRRRYR